MRVLFILLSVLLTLRFFVACAPSNSDYKAAHLAPKKKGLKVDSKVKMKAQSEAEKDQDAIEKETKIFAQLHNIYSEAWFVISKSRYGYPITIFDYAAKALPEINSNIKNKSCGISRVEEDGQIILREVNCKNKIKSDLIQWKWMTAKKIELSYINGVVSSIVPLGVLEFKSYSPFCEIELNDESEIQSFDCKEIGQRFEQKTKSFVFEKLKYQKTDPVMTLVGKTVDLDGDLVRYESEVPAEGDIKVKLTMLRAKKETAPIVPAIPVPPAPTEPVAPSPTQVVDGATDGEAQVVQSEVKGATQEVVIPEGRRARVKEIDGQGSENQEVQTEEVVDGNQQPAEAVTQEKIEGETTQQENVEVEKPDLTAR